MKDLEKEKGSRDLVIVLITSVIGTFLMVKLDIFELFFNTTREYEHLDLDEFFIGIFIFSIGITWFAFRRWRQSNQMVAQLRKLKRALIKNNEDLDIKVKKRTQDLETAQLRLIDQAHKTGMADVAANTLHNVGNLLNSVKTSAHLIRENLDEFPTGGFEMANELLKSHQNALESFLNTDPKGEKLVEYYISLGNIVKQQKQQILDHIEHLELKVRTIMDVINTQYNYPVLALSTEKCNLESIIEDALLILGQSLVDKGITIHKTYQEIPKVKVSRTKMVHILINLLRNSEQSLTEIEPGKREINLVLRAGEKEVVLEFWDSGKGVPAENLIKIFSFGFTTKSDGKGFGLHSCANYMSEMGHRIWAENDQLQHTKFILQFNI